jgi:hypothetical protein
MDQEISPRPVTTGSRVQSEAGTCEICGKKTGTGTCSSQSTFVFLLQYHSVNAPHSFHSPTTAATYIISNFQRSQTTQIRDFRLPPGIRRDPRSSGLLRSVQWQLSTYVLGQPISKELLLHAAYQPRRAIKMFERTVQRFTGVVNKKKYVYVRKKNSRKLVSGQCCGT